MENFTKEKWEIRNEKDKLIIVSGEEEDYIAMIPKHFHFIDYEKNVKLLAKAPELADTIHELILQIETFTNGNIGEQEYFEHEISRAKSLLKELE